jgi:uncharacterized protein YfaS (alpha-2-macroglobulin family)
MCAKTGKTPKKADMQKYGISAFTSGVISRESPIRIIFNESVVKSESLMTTTLLKDIPLSFSPSIKGTCSFTDERTLMFVPSERLKDGQKYQAKLKIAKLLKTKKDSDDFKFSFEAMRQDFNVTLEGFRSTQKAEIQQYTGQFITSDAEINMDAEKAVNAEHRGKKLPLQWTHSDDRRFHTFTIDSICRQDDSTVLTIKWDGSVIGVNKSEIKNVSVSSKNDFNAVSARPVQDSSSYVEIRFTDPLRISQNLDGLISIANYSELRFTIESNLVKVYTQGGFTGTVDITVNAGIKNKAGLTLKRGSSFTAVFEEILPQVRYLGKGVIIPTSNGLTIPFEAVNVKSVIVEAMQLYEDNLMQFFQVNEFDGSQELKRVGKIIWKKRVQLDITPDKQNKWIRCGFDVSPLIAKSSASMYRIRISFTKRDALVACNDSSGSGASDELTVNNQPDEEVIKEQSYWDYSEEYYNDGSYDYNYNYSDIKNPCSETYYKPLGGHDISVSQNFLISDIGIICKRAVSDTLYIATSDIKTTSPIDNAEITIFDYQQQIIGSGKTDNQGLVKIYTKDEPYVVVAKKSNQTGYLKIKRGTHLPVSHFDVSGETIQEGLKGFIYGERGVWRPGDTLFLTFILNDENSKNAVQHPVQFELNDAMGRLVKTIRVGQTKNNFYTFRVPTSGNDPTGNWMARVKVGGAKFEKELKVETIMPNRLKIAFDFGKKILLNSDQIQSKMFCQWLHGATAKNLDATVQLTLTKGTTTFSSYADYVFENPFLRYEPENKTIFESQLDDSGYATVNTDIKVSNVAPGMLNAVFLTKVFEPGGSFSIDNFSIPYAPYDYFIGIKTPKGDRARNMLLTDTNHVLDIVALTPGGKPVSSADVEVSMRQIHWRWWWEKGDESVGDYTNAVEYANVQKGDVKIVNGKGTWTFRINYPSWGRYLIEAKDKNTGHSTGKIIYIDWPGWAGRAQKDSPGGANVLTFASDKEAYTTGEDVLITIPSSGKGRALISLENGSRVLREEWATPENGYIKYKFKAEPEMAPTTYVSVTSLQPHLTSENDVPIRTYGIVPVKITDISSVLSPVIICADAFEPETKTTVEISESNGKPMTYTLAVVDEGLLGLTRFTTPDPWNQFNIREALGVFTWDMYDQVAGAYGAKLEKLLTIGGSDDGSSSKAKKPNRFPPMVRFYGPFDLSARESAKHVVDIPQYIGAVRVMVVAGNNTAWGKTDKSVQIKKPLMILATLPRVLSVNEKTELPVSIFALEKNIKNVNVSVKVKGPITISGEKNKKVYFKNTGDQIIYFSAECGNTPGNAEVTVEATSGSQLIRQTVAINIRTPASEATETIDKVIKPGKSITETIEFPGIAGTNKVVIEVSKLFPINLEMRLGYLIQYPHGCVEQTTSSVFPQLHLNGLFELDKSQQGKVESNIKAGIERLRSFQNMNGGFSYWPGDHYCDDWGSSYAGHFILEAHKAGYHVNPSMIQMFVDYQKKLARSWTNSSGYSALIQAYRLYTLALAGQPDVGAMNRLKESVDLSSTEKAYLAASYGLIGQKQIAVDILNKLSVETKRYRELSNTYGSDFRDKSIILYAMAVSGHLDKSHKIVKEISDNMAKGDWYSTQETAYALLALARYAIAKNDNNTFTVKCGWKDQKLTSYTDNKPVLQIPLKTDMLTNGTLTITNESAFPVYVNIIMKGIPNAGDEKTLESGLKLSVSYTNKSGTSINPSVMNLGDDIIATISVTNTGTRGQYKEVALSHLVPSGWEIHNSRMYSGDIMKNAQYDYRDIRDDRVYTYFDINQGETKNFSIICNASYAGKYYLPAIYAEAMYDNEINAQLPGMWVEVTK